MNRFADQEIKEDHITTLGIDYVSKNYSAKNGNVYKAKIWDTAGQERFRTLTYSFYKKADGIIIAYDITEQKSFEAIKNWLDSINDFASIHVPVIMVGNKVDLDDQRAVSYNQACTFANSHKLKYMETSAKNNTGI